MARNAIHINRADKQRFDKEMERMQNALSRKEINSIQRRNARPIEQQMKTDAPSQRIAQMVAITTRQTKKPRAPGVGIRVGVINNDPSLFPDFSAPALASVLEYGTKERFRKLKAGGIITGRVSTGRVTDEQRWLRRAWDMHIKQFISKTERGYRKKVEG